MINKTDSYKVSHWLQQPKDMIASSYYLESRSKNKKLRFFGLQAILKKHFMNCPTRAEVAQVGAWWERHGVPFNFKGWNYIAGLGYYPLSIVAPREGSIVNSDEAMITVESTDSEVPWLPGWFETMLMQVWYPITVCTRSYECKMIIKDHLEKTGDVAGLPFKLHDFGYRGTSSNESAGIGGAAHLVNFMGTDTSEAIRHLEDYYGATEVMPAFSIPASEHSTITSWGKGGEVDAYKNMLDQFGKTGKIFACVSDSYDLSNAILNLWGGELKERVKESGATLVIRPDSGDPARVVLRTIREIQQVFGYSVNSKGYKVLPDYIRVIQGDGISTPGDIESILYEMEKREYSADNIAFGMGGGLLQNLNRDTYKFAMKMSAINRGGTWHDVYKEPKDAPWKTSKKGRQVVRCGFPVYRDGELLVDDDINVIRARA